MFVFGFVICFVVAEGLVLFLGIYIVYLGIRVFDLLFVFSGLEDKIYVAGTGEIGRRR